MSTFDDFREEVLGEVAGLAREFLGGNVEEARTVARAFVDQSKAKLERWLRLLAAGDLTQDEFNDLVRSQKDLAQLHALAEVGIAAEKVEQFRVKLTDVVITKAIDVLL